jgi:hypothetical protein
LLYPDRGHKKKFVAHWKE